MECGKATNIVYIPSIYPITSAGKQPTLDLLIKVISALPVKPDEAVAGYVLTIYQESAKGQWLYNLLNLYNLLFNYYGSD